MCTDIEKTFMRRCFTLARYGLGEVKTNPLVGSVLVYKDQIIAEGFHERYGSFHAERNALSNIPDEYNAVLPQCTLYVSLEPCNHQGKTPPCTDIILEKGIKKVIIAQLDPNPIMSGKSVRLLKENGIEVKVGLCAEEARQLNKKFIINQTQKRPYIVLKYAESKYGYIGLKDKQVWLSNPQSKVLVHKWRSENMGILIGTNTAIVDNPQLTNRLYSGSSPKRIIIDRNQRIPKTHYVLSDQYESIIYTTDMDYHLPSTSKTIVEIKESDQTMQLTWIMQDLYNRGIANLLIEGGKELLSHLIKNDLWDECRIIKTNSTLNQGIKSPNIKGIRTRSARLGSDKIEYILSHNLKKILTE